MFVVGVVLALARPGNLGDNDETAAGTSSSTSTSSSELSSTSSSLAETTTTATVASSTTSSPATTTTAVPNGSGLGTGGAGSVDSGTTANTGGPAWLLPVGGLLLFAGLATRRLTST